MRALKVLSAGRHDAVAGEPQTQSGTADTETAAKDAAGRWIVEQLGARA